MQYKVVISLWCARIDLRSLNMWDGCRVVRLWTNSSYVHIAWIGRCYWCLMQYEVVISLSCAVQIRYNGNGGSALIFVCWMYGTCVVLSLDEQRVRLCCLNWAALWVLDSVWGRNNLTIMRCANTLQWRWRLRIDLRLLNAGVGLALHEQAVRLYCCVCATIWHVLLVFDAIWGRNLILMLCCPNTLK